MDTNELMLMKDMKINRLRKELDTWMMTATVCAGACLIMFVVLVASITR